MVAWWSVSVLQPVPRRRTGLFVRRRRATTIDLRGWQPRRHRRLRLL